MLFQSIEAHASSQSNHDRQWVHTAMAFLNAFVEDARMDLLVGVQDKKEYVKTLVDALLSTAASLESGQYKHIYIYIYPLIYERL